LAEDIQHLNGPGWGMWEGLRFLTPTPSASGASSANANKPVFFPQGSSDDKYPIVMRRSAAGAWLVLQFGTGATPVGEGQRCLDGEVGDLFCRHDPLIGAGETETVQETMRFVEEVVTLVGGAPLGNHGDDGEGGVSEHGLQVALSQ
jgi:hypothetical protein